MPRRLIFFNRLARKFSETFQRSILRKFSTHIFVNTFLNPPLDSVPLSDVGSNFVRRKWGSIIFAAMGCSQDVVASLNFHYVKTFFVV